MSCKSDIRFTGALALLLCLMPSACGGDGYGVASTPPPPPTPAPTPTPTPTPSPALPAGTTTFNYPASNPVAVRTSWLDSPTTRLGTTDVVGLLSLPPGNGSQPTTRPTAAGEFTITTSQPNLDHQYALNGPVGIFPGGLNSITGFAAGRSWEINDTVAYLYELPYADIPQYFGQRLSGFSPGGTQLFSFDYSRTNNGGSRIGLGPNQNLQSTLTYDIGYSYVAMGEWSWRAVDLDGKPLPGTDSGKLLFVNGDRTPESGIPVSGKATYDARSLKLLSRGAAPGIPFTLTANFGARTISAAITQDYQILLDPDDAGAPPVLGIRVTGSALFANSGAFGIPLSGTVNYSDQKLSVIPLAEAVTGMMNGAFFGPNAEQVGGTFSLDRATGAPIQDAFVGQQRKP